MSISPKIILDASAIIAYLDDEPGSDIVEEWLPDSAASMVNICEVISVLAREGKPEEQVSEGVRDLIPTIVLFSWEIARATAAMIKDTQPKGLGLGDRAALATVKVMNLPVLTAESRWLEVPTGADIRLIRQRHVPRC